MNKNILIVFILLNFLGCTTNNQSKRCHIGYMYWYHPTISQEKWDLVLTGTVTVIGKKEALNEFIDMNESSRSGTIKINEVLFQERYDAISKKELAIFDYDIIDIGGGFNHLKIGDKILLFLTIYEGAYAIGHFEGTETHLGIKLKTFNDDIVKKEKGI